MRVCAIFYFPSFRGLEAALRMENGGLLIGKNGNLGCLGRFSHSTENSEEPWYGFQVPDAKFLQSGSAESGKIVPPYELFRLILLSPRRSFSRIFFTLK
jgi:hypothetical protein